MRLRQLLLSLGKRKHPLEASPRTSPSHLTGWVTCSFPEPVMGRAGVSPRSDRRCCGGDRGNRGNACVGEVGYLLERGKGVCVELASHMPTTVPHGLSPTLLED